MEHQPTMGSTRTSVRIRTQLAQAALANREERVRLGRATDAVLRKSANWHVAGRPLVETPHFARYRTDQHRHRYERALDALGSGRASATELELVRALSAEIASSRVIIKADQMLLSGDIREGLLLDRAESFVWATVHPLSAVESAEQRLPPGHSQSPIVYQFRLDQPMPALVCRAGRHGKWDLLLPRRLRVTVTATHQYRRLTVKEAVIGT